MSEVSVIVSYGKINLSGASGVFSALRVKPLFERDSAANTGRVNVKATTFSASTTMPELGGGFTSKQVAHDAGTVIMLQGSRTRRGVRIADGCIFIRLRACAPKLMIRGILPTGEQSVLGDKHIVFVGSGDVLSVDELKALGYEIPRSWVSGYMQQEEIDELFEVDELNKGSGPRPSFVRIATSNGVEVRAVQAEPVRRMRIRR